MKWCAVLTHVSPCHSISEVAGSTMKESIININFPPGRPNSANIVPLCAFRKHRRRYLTRCLPRRDVDWLTHQLKAINGLEKEFGQCCKERKDIQACTEGKACIDSWVFTG